MWDLFDQVRSVTKTRQNNNMTDWIGVVYVETKIELSWPIGSCGSCDENQRG